MSDANRWDVMSIREYTDATGAQKTQWTKIGAGFTNKNGSINVILDAFPIDGKLQLQVPLTREQREELFNARGGQPQAPRGAPQGNPRNAGQQQRQGAAQRYGQRGQSAPQRAARDTEYTPPSPEDEAQGWMIGTTWITDARQLPKDHPDFLPF